jgi:ABC-type glycerol-3-phosphate transport system substrate-binding protein
MKMPDTTEEFLAVAKAFTMNDPDGNGRADTVGFSAPADINGSMFFFAGAFGVPNGWKADGGKLIPWQTHNNEVKAFLSYMNRMYAENGLDKDFVLISNQSAQDKFVSGKIGIHDNNPMNLSSTIRPPMEQNDPRARITAMLPPKGPTGLRAKKTGAIGSKMVINSSIPAAKQTRLLELYDYMLSDEGYDIIKNGIEGVHYQKNANGTFAKLPKFDEDRPFLFSVWLLRRYDPIIQIRKWDSRELAEEVSTAINNAGKFAVRNPAHGLISQTSLRVGANIGEKLQETIVRIIVGELNVDAYDRAVTDWLGGGGQTIINEINAEYVKMNQ